MSKSPFKMANVCHKFQFDFILAKLELILANPLAKVSINLTVGTQKIETTQRPKASKETILKETLYIITSLYEDPKRGYQEKFATLEVCLNNSKVSNVIGMLKLDLAGYVHSSGDKLELIVLQKSAEYQGKILLGVNCMPVEQGEEDEGSQINAKNYSTALEPNDSVSQRGYSDAGLKNGNKRALTPNLRITKNPATDKLMHMVDRVIKQSEMKSEESKEHNRKSSNLLTKSTTAFRQEKKIMSLFDPILSKTNDVIKEYTNDEKAKLEKVIFALKSDKHTAESRIIENEQKVNESLKEYEGVKEKYQEMEKENYKLRLENEDLKQSLQKERNVINDLMQGDGDKLEILKKSDLSVTEKRLEEVKKENEKLLEEKYKLENGLAVQRKNMDEVNKKLVIQLDENSALKRENGNQYEFIAKKEKQIKMLIDEINKGKEKGIAESFVLQTDKLKLVEDQLTAQDDELAILKKNFQEKSNLLAETKASLEKSNKEVNWQKNEIQSLNEKLSNIEKIMEIKDENLKMLEDLQINYIKCKQNLADIVNLVFENRNFNLLEEIDKLITP